MGSGRWEKTGIEMDGGSAGGEEQIGSQNILEKVQEIPAHGPLCSLSAKSEGLGWGSVMTWRGRCLEQPGFGERERNEWRNRETEGPAVPGTKKK